MDPGQVKELLDVQSSPQRRVTEGHGACLGTCIHSFPFAWPSELADHCFHNTWKVPVLYHYPEVERVGFQL